MQVGCSVPILTLNSRVGLERLLPMLLPVFDDVFIVDGGSTDGTREYARSLGVRVEDQTPGQKPNTLIQDFAVVRRRSWSLARHDWIFYLDSDEIPSLELLRVVKHLVEENRTTFVHEFVRKARLPSGLVIEEAFFYPEYCLRLFARSSGAYLHERPVHERVVLPQNVRIQRHAEWFEAGWPTPQVFWQKQKRYLSLEESASVSPALGWFLRWGIVYNIVMFVAQAIRAIAVYFRALMRRRSSLPWRYTMYFLWYRVLSIRSAFRAWKRKRASVCVA